MSIEKRPSGWLARINVNGERISQMFPKKRDAEAWEAIEKEAIKKAGLPLGDGPSRTTLAQAMAIFAERETKNKKGAVQELNRLNRWFDVAGLPRLKLVIRENNTRQVVEDQSQKALPRQFAALRDKRLAASAPADIVRARLAMTPMSSIAKHQIEDLQRKLKDCGAKPDTVRLEIALLKRLFRVSRDKWNWRYDAFPFDKYEMPQKGPERIVRIPPDKQDILLTELGNCRNPYILPYVLLAIETTMRRGEALRTATWNDVDFDNRQIFLREDKAGRGRCVPLTLDAVEILRSLPRKEGDVRLFPISDSMLQSAWKKACKRAGVTGLRIHDLRHEGASRHSLALNGNVFLLKEITGHRTLEMLQRYVNPTKQEVLRALDAAAGSTPASMKSTRQLVANGVDVDGQHADERPTSRKDRHLTLIQGGME